MYATYFGFGAINFVPRRGIVGTHAVWLIAVGLAAFGVGVWLRTLFSVNRPESTRVAPADLLEVTEWRRTALFFGTAGAAAAAAIVVVFGGIPLFALEDRKEISAPLTGLMFGLFLAVSITAGHALFNRRWRLLACCVVGVCLLILLGYRTFVLIPIGTIFFTARNLGLVRLKIRWWVFGAAAVFGLAWLGFYRFNAGKDAVVRQFLVLGLPEQYTPLIPVWATPREGTSVFALLVEKFPATWDYQNGRMLGSVFEVLLPGKQLGPRLQVVEYIGGRPGISLTPSILGEPYVDFGVTGVIVAMLLIGFFLKSVWIWQASSLTWAPRVASAFVLTILLIDIHAGLLDVQVLAGPLFMLWWARRAEARARKQQADASDSHSVQSGRRKARGHRARVRSGTNRSPAAPQILTGLNAVAAEAGVRAPPANRPSTCSLTGHGVVAGGSDR